MSIVAPPAPAKMRPFLDAAEGLGLQVREHADPDGLGGLLVRAWRISRHPDKGYSGHVVFAYWTDTGYRGGRRSFYLYNTHRMRSHRITGRTAYVWLQSLAM